MKRNEWVGKLSNKNSWGNEYLAVLLCKKFILFGQILFPEYYIYRKG